ncbi:MAG: iron ABC transporter permease [Chloroflexi bacterium]|nr:iron ABC transporter permease [Chloroflexota bacterium]
MRLIALVLAGLLLVLIAGALVGLALGPVKLDVHQVLKAIFSGEDPMAHAVVWDLRLPRVAAALVVGACLGLSGCLLQSATRNPLGDPQLFGLGGGAALVQALAIAGLLSLGTWALCTLSVAASLVGAAGIALFASRQGISPARLALIGVSISALAAALATGILAKARTFSMQALNFIGGSFANVTWQDLLPALPFLGAGLLLALPAAGNLNVLALGDRVAANLGAAPGRTRSLAIAASGILGGAAVAVAGLVGFVGLLIPHLARLLVGHDFRRVLIVSIPLGAAFTLWADQAARLLFMPSEIPVGLVTALVGAPLMIYVARRVL